MEHLTRTELRRMLETGGKTCISLYLPTHRHGAETQQDPIRLKNLLRETEEALQKRGTDKQQINDLLAPARAMLHDYDFWQHRDAGLAIFRSPDLFNRYRVDLAVPELAIVGSKFHLKPLFARLATSGRFYVLALSQNHSRFFRATRDGITEIEPARMPASLSEALGERAPEKHLQAHSAGSGGAIFHVQGAGEDHKKEDLLQYFHRIDRGIGEFFGGERPPLVLAAVDYLYPLYRQANSKAELLEEWVSGSPDALEPRELHERALKIASWHFARGQKKAVDQYMESWHTQRASNKLEVVLPAAHRGRVQALFVAVGVQTWGRFEPGTGEVELSPENTSEGEDLLNLAAVQTFATGGVVYAVAPQEVPGGKPLAAVFRY